MVAGTTDAEAFRKQATMETGDWRSPTETSTLLSCTSYVILDGHAWLLNISDFLGSTDASVESQTKEIRGCIFNEIHVGATWLARETFDEKTDCEWLNLRHWDFCSLANVSYCFTVYILYTMCKRIVRKQLPYDFFRVDINIRITITLTQIWTLELPEQFVILQMYEVSQMYF